MKINIMTKKQQILLWSLGAISVVALGTATFIVIKRKRESQIMERSIKEMNEKYNIYQ